MRIDIAYEDDEFKITIPFAKLVEVLGLSEEQKTKVEAAVREAISKS